MHFETNLFFSIFGGVGGHFTITDHLKLLTSLVRPSDNCSPTRIIQTPFHFYLMIYRSSISVSSRVISLLLMLILKFQEKMCNFLNEYQTGTELHHKTKGIYHLSLRSAKTIICRQHLVTMKNNNLSKSLLLLL